MDHVLIIKNWGTISFFIRRLKYSSQDYENLHLFCAKNGFEWIDGEGMSSGQSGEEFDLIMKTLVNGETNFLNEYALRVSPPSDDSPYFHQFLKWSGLKSLKTAYTSQSIAFFEIGYLLVWVTLIQVVVLSLVLIVIPVILNRSHQGGVKYRWPFLYFASIGLGFMFVEINILQQSIPFLGNPVTASAVVITVLS